ncbi:hypothetical protein NQZ79_g3549 [Umbelopsis isabellina]|nr:hypothetical protein NQZ79_g3549 [Umbelopsis isabellina]
MFKAILSLNVKSPVVTRLALFMHASPPLPNDYDSQLPPPPPVPEHSTLPPTYTAQPSRSQAFELALLACKVTDLPQAPAYLSCCVLEHRFLLLGCVDSLTVIDLKHPDPPKIIIWTRVRSIKVIESCRTIMMICSRHRQVRCYSLDAILLLCYTVLGLDWSKRQEPHYEVPDLQVWRKAADDSPKRSMSDYAANRTANAGMTSSQSNNTLSIDEPEPPVLHKPSGAGPRPPSPPLTLAGRGMGKLYYQYKGMIPQDCYFKLSDFKDPLDLDLYLTSTSAFLAVIAKEKVAMWQKNRHDQTQPWRRVKSFWIPAEPLSLSLADDRITLRYIIAVFRNEATVINLRTSKVHTIRLEQPVIDRYLQLELIQQRLPTGSQSNQEPYQIPRPESMPWTSLIQLPFYPNTLPPNALTEEYSVPPPYSLVVDEPSDALHDPVALPSTSAPQLFLATLSRHSFLTDMSGSLFSRTTYTWSEIPSHIELARVTPKTSLEQLLIIGFLSQSIEVLDVRTGKLIHTVPMSGQVRYLGRWDDDLVTKAIFWTCNIMDRTYVYMLRTQ